MPSEMPPKLEFTVLNNPNLETNDDFNEVWGMTADSSFQPNSPDFVPTDQLAHQSSTGSETQQLQSQASSASEMNTAAPAFTPTMGSPANPEGE